MVSYTLAQGGAVGPYVKREEGDVLVAVVDIVHNGDGCFSGPAEPLDLCV